MSKIEQAKKLAKEAECLAERGKLLDVVQRVEQLVELAHAARDAEHSEIKALIKGLVAASSDPLV